MKTSPHPQQSFMSEQLEAWVLDDFRDLPLFRKILADQSLETFGGRSARNKTWGGVATTWVQGSAEADLAPKLTQMKKSGWRVRHLNAWNLPNNGDVRFDVVWEQLTWCDEVVRLNMTGAQVVQEYGTQWNRAFKFRTLDTFRIGNEQRYAGVWNPNTNGQSVL